MQSYFIDLDGYSVPHCFIVCIALFHVTGKRKKLKRKTEGSSPLQRIKKVSVFSSQNVKVDN